MISDWSVKISKKLKKQVKNEVINQNINLQTAIIQALELWINSPTTDKINIKDVEQEDLDELDIGFFKQCCMVDRDYVTNDCRAWINNNCLMISALKFYLPIKNTTSTNSELDFFDDNFTLPEDGIDLDGLLKSIEKNIIVKALKKTKGRKTKVSNLLNISYDSLKYRIESLNINND